MSPNRNGNGNPAIRVLIAEDNEDHRFLTERALRTADSMKFDIDSVRDGVEALDYLFKRGEFADRPTPHLVLLDLKMPRKDGLQVLRELKGDPELRTVPVVVLTSSDQPADVDTAYKLGGNSYVTKPASATRFREGLRFLANYWAGWNLLPTPPA